LGGVVGQGKGICGLGIKIFCILYYLF